MSLFSAPRRIPNCLSRLGTGIAATHIGGAPRFTPGPLGIRDSLSEHDQVWLASNDKLRKRCLSTDVLVIDEVSMLHGARLDMVNQAAKLLRGSNEPFGGLQVIWWRFIPSCPQSAQAAKFLILRI